MDYSGRLEGKELRVCGLSLEEGTHISQLQCLEPCPRTVYNFFFSSFEGEGGFLPKTSTTASTGHLEVTEPAQICD